MLGVVASPESPVLVQQPPPIEPTPLPPPSSPPQPQVQE